MDFTPFSVGTKVILKGLKGASQYNGKEGIVSGPYDAKKDRYPIEITELGKELSVRSSNIEKKVSNSLSRRGSFILEEIRNYSQIMHESKESLSNAEDAFKLAQQELSNRQCELMAIRDKVSSLENRVESFERIVSDRESQLKAIKIKREAELASIHKKVSNPSQECIICRKILNNVPFIPCGHQICCIKDAKSMKEKDLHCPVCKELIQGVDESKD